MGDEKRDVEAVLDPVLSPPHWYGARHTQMVLLFLLPLLAYATRVNMSVGIVAMTDPEASENPDVPTYEWEDQGIVLSAFFMGYFVTQPAGGLLAKIYGPKWIIAASITANSVLGILTPVVAPFGSWAVSVCRLLQGLGQGFIYPCIHQALSKWAPPLERARLGTFVYCGGHAGTVFSMSLTGWISKTWLGWPWAFYICGTAGLVWTVLWVILGKNSPADHKTIDPLEKSYIQFSLGQVQSASPPTPWKAIFTSKPFWAILAANVGQGWGFTILLTNIPTYMGNALGFDIQKNGVLSALPYLVLWIFCLISGFVSDFVVSRNYVTTGLARKIANTISFCVPGLCLLALGWIGGAEWDTTNVSLALIFLSVGFNGSSTCGYHMNHIDLSPVHSGTLLGLTNGIGNCIGFIAPLVLQVIVTDKDDPLQWSTIFYISSAIYIVSNAIYVVFGSGELQAWNNLEVSR
ncbi:putative inorganic phosphate cotransporter [Photinus pyralis]|nr:putative inorganic phosphate cotransporter [Photinus pyralis]XP_031355305.1 putative inorganic phosphate cotransporter [Photinus pyralis]